MALFECKKKSAGEKFPEIISGVLYTGTTATTLTISTNTSETVFIYDTTYGSGISNLSGGDILAKTSTGTAYKGVVVKPTSDTITFSVDASNSGMRVVYARIKKSFNSADLYGNSQTQDFSNVSKDDLFIFGSGNRGATYDTNNTWVYSMINNFIFQPLFDNNDAPMNYGFFKATDDVNNLKAYYGTSGYIAGSSKFRLYNE